LDLPFVKDSLLFLVVESFEVVWLDSVGAQRVDLSDWTFIDKLAVFDELALSLSEGNSLVVGVLLSLSLLLS